MNQPHPQWFELDQQTVICQYKGKKTFQKPSLSEIEASGGIARGGGQKQSVLDRGMQGAPPLQCHSYHKSPVILKLTNCVCGVTSCSQDRHLLLKPFIIVSSSNSQPVPHISKMYYHNCSCYSSKSPWGHWSLEFASMEEINFATYRYGMVV